MTGEEEEWRASVQQCLTRTDLPSERRCERRTEKKSEQLQQENDNHLRSAQKPITPILIIHLWLSIISEELREDFYDTAEFTFFSVTFTQRGSQSCDDQINLADQSDRATVFYPKPAWAELLHGFTNLTERISMKNIAGIPTDRIIQKRREAVSYLIILAFLCPSFIFIETWNIYCYAAMWKEFLHADPNRLRESKLCTAENRLF